jgi:peptidoglycan/xylan/chitin deacetylase (PgdA/CDA1 family)
MSKEELLKMKSSGMVIGSHSVNYPVMSKLTVGEQRLEIEGSFNFLRKISVVSSKKTFCYPCGGFHSFTDETIKILEDNKCIYSFNVEPRDITSDDLRNYRQALPRYDCNLSLRLSV